MRKMRRERAAETGRAAKKERRQKGAGQGAEGIWKRGQRIRRGKHETRQEDRRTEKSKANKADNDGSLPV